MGHCEKRQNVFLAAAAASLSCKAAAKGGFLCVSAESLPGFLAGGSDYLCLCALKKLRGE